jgi:hypothetical protein
MIKTNNYSFLKYLSYYDLINKYSLKSIYLVPQLDKITLKIAIEQNFAVKLKAQYKAFLFYYLHNFCCSKIILNFFTSLKKRVKTMTLKSKITIDISHKKIFEFLISLMFLLNNKSLDITCAPALRSFNAISGKPQYEHLHLLFATPASIFSSKSNQNHQQINFTDLTVFFNFSLKNIVALAPFNFFEKKKNNNLHINLFKNIFIFWALKF